MMCRQSKAISVSKSQIETVDPIVRALNTLMYGLLVHFTTIWSIEQYINNKQCTNEKIRSYFPFMIILHEYWIFLQHSNVLANPHLQHLDRQYGIALLKKNQHWAIAGTLSSYWCRESISMFLSLSYLQNDDRLNTEAASSHFSITQYLILYSLVYHTIKSRGVRSDAIRRYSDKFGIMRIVIDRFYLDSLQEFAMSILRVFLQGLDTFIHYCIVRDMMISSPISSLKNSIHIVFVIWVVHAALNQFFRCSTASLIVLYWRLMTAKPAQNQLVQDDPNKTLRGIQINEQISIYNKSGDYEDKAGIIKCESQTSSCSSSVSEHVDVLENDDKFVVRQLLHHERVPHHLRGKDGSASVCVDKAVRVETAITIISVLFMVGLGKVPLEVLFDQLWSHYSKLRLSIEQIYEAVLFAWLFWGILHGLWTFFLKASHQSGRKKNARSNRLRSSIYAIDMMAMIAIQKVTSLRPSGVWFVCVSITAKSFLKTERTFSPKLLTMAFLGIEFASKLALLRELLGMSFDDHIFAPITSILTVFWLIWVVSNPIPTPWETSDKNSSVADAVFLGHPAELSDLWAHWLLPYSLHERWKPPFWALPLWPLHFVVGIFLCKYRRKIFGDGFSHFCCDDVCYGEIRMQNWVNHHFGRHFVTHQIDVKHNIEAAARHAEKCGVKVLCLGALNKAESINGGGVSLIKHLGPNRDLSVIHGNHLTAAAVVETINQCFGTSTRFFLTGASSKVGWAVAQALRDCGHRVLCHSTNKGRREFFEKNGFASASSIAMGAAYTNYWIIGKYDKEVAREIPQNGVAVVFSVPHPLGGRKDVRVIEAGTLHMDLKRLDRPRVFTNKLNAHEIFACHAASVVAVHRLRTGDVKRIDEVGPVDTKEMNSWLTDAKHLGFHVPIFEPIAPLTSMYFQPTVVIVGAGPAGLCAAAGLSVQNIPFIILEACTDTETFGSWNILSQIGANVTTQRKWCNLTGYEMDDREFPGEYLSPKDYQRYLKQYANRFSITNHIRRGIKVVSVERNDSQDISWKVLVDKDIMEQGNEIMATSVIIATGKHRVPCKNTSDDVVSKLIASNIPFAHSTEMTPKNWKLAFHAAMNGTLCIVGFGNSAADISSAILQNCDHKGINGPMIHVAARTVPPVFPQKMSLLRADTFGYVLRLMPLYVQELIIKLLWRFIPSSHLCNSSFPSHLKRWSKVHGKIPVIDKGCISSGFASGRLHGHGPILDIDRNGGVVFADHSHSLVTDQRVKIDMVILATGYKDECVVDREDRPSGLYKLGFEHDNFLPLYSMCNEAQIVVKDIVARSQVQ